MKPTSAELDTAAISTIDSAPVHAALRLTGVEKRYPGVWALRGIDLEVAPGEVHGIVGENGAGKSTMMAISAGALSPDAGEVEIAGEALPRADRDRARDLGLAIVYQEPALVPDLTIAENVQLTLPGRLRRTQRDRDAWVAEMLAEWRPSSTLDPQCVVRDLAPVERFIVEIARALAQQPKVLVLDEPTEHLLPDDIERLFAKVRAICDAGGTVVYISHHISEVKRITDRITVLRDGCVRGTFAAADISEEEIVALVVGRELTSRFPAKAIEAGPERLVAQGLRGPGIEDVDVTVRAGEILGLAGVDGQGQREVLRMLAGLTPSRGAVAIDGQPIRLRDSAAAGRAGIAHVPSDRLHEGVLSALSVRENLTLAGLAGLARAGFVRTGSERRQAERERARFGIKTPSLESKIDDLSGGNQQKVLLARALSSEPAVILADEPTQGVDVGARAEIYQMLRDTADAGAGVVILSTNNGELEGLCDRVLVFSRGRVVRELAGGEVSEHAIANSVLTATTGHRDERGRSRSGWIAGFTRSERAPAGVLMAVIALLTAWVASVDGSYLSALNLTSVLTLFAALAFIALGQQLVMLTGGIDLSVGPLVGVLVVIASFVLADNRTSYGLFLGALMTIAATCAVGLANWSLVAVTRIQPMIATLVTYMALQSVSLLLRPEPGGSISTSLSDLAGVAIGPVPVVALLAVAAGLLLELSLRGSRWGWRLRAVGSSPAAAQRSGVRTWPVLLTAYGGCAVLTLLGAVMVMAQVGSGDPTSGINYTFASISAIVLGGASIFGGRGSFLGALAGSLLVVQINTAAVFLHLGDAWQLYLLGGLTAAAAGFYSVIRRTE